MEQKLIITVKNNDIGKQTVTVEFDPPLPVDTEEFLKLPLELRDAQNTACHVANHVMNALSLEKVPANEG